MANNPLVNQGKLNRLRATIQVNDIPALNVTPAFLGRDGISLALEGEATTTIPTLTGTVQSPEPYQMARITVHLLKSQALAATYKAQMESNTLIGTVIVRPDASTLPSYTINNCALAALRELDMSGRDAGWVVSITGFYSVNNQLWNLV